MKDTTRMRERERRKDREAKKTRTGSRHNAEEAAPRSGGGLDPPKGRQGRAVLPAWDELRLPERVEQL